jgi:WD40 repeat protein
MDMTSPHPAESASLEPEGRARRSAGAGPWRVRWSRTPAETATAVLTGHDGWVWALCPVSVGGATLLAAADDHGVRLWDPATGQVRRALDCGPAWAKTLCTVEVDGTTLLAVGTETDGDHGSVRLWDPATGALRPLTDHDRDGVQALCSVDADGRPLLAAAGYDVELIDARTGAPGRALGASVGPETDPANNVSAVCPVEVAGRTLLATTGTNGSEGRVELWDPATGDRVRRLDGNAGWTLALSAVPVAGRTLLAVGHAAVGHSGPRNVIRLWDPATGRLERDLDRLESMPTQVCPAVVDGRTLLAVGHDDGAVRLWNPVTGECERVFEGHTRPVRAVCVVDVAGRTLVASGSQDGSIRLWDPSGGPDTPAPPPDYPDQVEAVVGLDGPGPARLATLSRRGPVRLWSTATGSAGRVLDASGDARAICRVERGGRDLLAVTTQVGDDSTLRLWDPDGEEPALTLRSGPGAFRITCTAELDGRTVLVAAGRTPRIWDLDTGQPGEPMKPRFGLLYAMCPIDVEGSTLIAVAGNDTLLLWDPRTDQPPRSLPGRAEYTVAVCAVEAGGRWLLASAGDDNMVWLWDPASGEPVHALAGHTGTVQTVFPVRLGERSLLASGGDDRAVRLWDPATGELLDTIPVQHRITSGTHASGALAVGLEAGVLTLGLADPF